MMFQHAFYIAAVLSVASCHTIFVQLAAEGTTNGRSKVSEELTWVNSLQQSVLGYGILHKMGWGRQVRCGLFSCSLLLIANHWRFIQSYCSEFSAVF
jgi:hypothetical protein